MRLPTWEELESVEEQLDVLEWPLDEPLFVAGPPGSGKTVLAVRRAQMTAEAGPGTLIVTYNRMLRRLLNLLDQSLEAKTMHGHVGPDYRRRAAVSKVPTLPHDSHAFIWDEMMRVLSDLGVGPNRRHLVVDEGQDLPYGFFAYASRHISRMLSVFVDDDQALRDQRTTLEDIKRAAAFPGDPIFLTQNHRNTPEVARLAEHFHTGRLPAAAVRRSRAGERPRLSEASTLEAAATAIATWRTNQGGSIGVIVDRNNVCGQLYELLRQKLPNSRADFYSYDSKNENKTNVLEDGVTVLNKESVKGQEFDAVFVLELHRFLPCRSDSEKRGMYMMCSRARDHLWLICGPGGRLTQAIDEALPGPDVLERV